MLKYKAMLLRHGWIQSVFDPCSYTLQNAVGVAHLLTIVDDSPILADSIAMRDSVHASIASEFKITIDNDCKYLAAQDSMFSKTAIPHTHFDRMAQASICSMGTYPIGGTLILTVFQKLRCHRLGEWLL